MQDNEFYIGWMPKAPRSFAKHARNVVIVLAFVVISVSIILAISQKKFSDANFEFGKLTTVQGVYLSSPVPALRVMNEKNNLLTIPLLGYGKFGAEGLIQELEKQQGISLNQKEVSLKGTLLYNHGKLLMQVAAEDSPLVAVGKKVAASLVPVKEELGVQTLRGEIVDPKCYFGVMKPGQGKPHKDCAIRCILGGIPPVLRVQNEQGESNYYLVVGPHGEKMNEAVKDFVAEPVALTANVVRYDDWIVLYVNDKQRIAKISRREMLGVSTAMIACGK